MRQHAIISTLILAAAGGVSGCEMQQDKAQVSRFAPVYGAIDTRLLDGDLVNFHVSMIGARAPGDVEDFGECAAAQYALIRGYGFARHVRTNVNIEGSTWSGDAVYTISPALPRGNKTIDAEVTVSACVENGIPTV